MIKLASQGDNHH